MEKDEKTREIVIGFVGCTMSKTSISTPLTPLLEGKLMGVPRWYELPYNSKLKQRARSLRKAGNKAEVVFWNAVKKKQFLGLDFDRQKVIGNYIVDFYCKRLGVIVEVDGKSHDDKEEYDRKRDEYLIGLGLKMIHFTDVEVKKNLKRVLDALELEIREWVTIKSSAKS